MCFRVTYIHSLIQLPVLSTGEGVGCRVCLCEGVSSVSGRWRVEECEEEEGEGGGPLNQETPEMRTPV